MNCYHTVPILPKKLVTIIRTQKSNAKSIQINIISPQQINMQNKSQPKKKRKAHIVYQLHMEIHQNTCLNGISPNTQRVTITKPINVICNTDLNNVQCPFYPKNQSQSLEHKSQMQNPYKFVSKKSKGLKRSIRCLYDETIQNIKALVESRLFSMTQF